MRIYCEECGEEIGEILSNGTIVGSFENIHVDVQGHIHIGHPCHVDLEGEVETLGDEIEELKDEIRKMKEIVEGRKTSVKKAFALECLNIILTNLTDIFDRHNQRGIM